MANLTRNGVVGLELTREELVDLRCKAEALEQKAACREVNESVLDIIENAIENLRSAQSLITDILESEEE